MTTKKRAGWHDLPTGTASVAAHAGRLTPFLPDQVQAGGLKKLDISAIAAAQEAINDFTAKCKALRDSLPAASRALLWMYASPDAKALTPLPFEQVCEDLSLVPAEMRKTMLKNIPAAFRCMLFQETGFECPMIPGRICGEKADATPWRKPDNSTP